MCNPAAFFVAGSALSIGQSFLGYSQQAKYAKAQQAAQEQAYRANYDAATSEAISTYNQNNLSLAQKRQQSAAEIQRIVRQARVATGVSRSAAAKAGVAGESVRNLLIDYEKKVTSFRSAVERNDRFAKQQTETANQAAMRRRTGRIMSSLPDIIPQPNLFNAFLGAGAGVFSAFNDAAITLPDGSKTLTPP